MKKLLSALIVFIIVFTGLISCAPDTEGLDEKYTGPQIASIEYKTNTSMSGLTNYRILDFSEGSVYKIIDYPNIDGYEAKHELICTFDVSYYTAIVDAFYSKGLLDLEEVYEPEGTVMDGGSWSLTIQYENGSRKASSGYVAGPYEIFTDSDIAFWDITGAEFLGYVPDSYKTAPGISVAYSTSEDVIPAYEYISLPACNATWRNKSYELDDSFTRESFELESSESHIFILKPYKDNEVHKIKSAALFTYDPNDGSLESVSCTVTASEITFSPAVDKYYILTVEYELGTAEYRFSTTLAK